MPPETPPKHYPVLSNILPALLIAFIIAAIVLVVPGVIQRQNADRKQRQAAAEAYPHWVAWRGKHCRFEGPLQNGQFVCDNGKQFSGMTHKFGEYKQIPPWFSSQNTDHSNDLK